MGIKIKIGVIKKMEIEQRFEKLKSVMINNLETLHDMFMDQMDESEEYYDAFGKEFDNMIEAVRVI